MIFLFFNITNIFIKRYGPSLACYGYDDLFCTLL